MKVREARLQCGFEISRFNVYFCESRRSKKRGGNAGKCVGGVRVLACVR